MRLLLVLAIISVWSAETLQQNDDITSLIQSMLDVDRALEKEIKTDISQAKIKQYQLGGEFLNSLNESVNTLKNALNERFSKLQANEQAYEAFERILKQNLMEEWKNIVEEINTSKDTWKRQKEAKFEEKKEYIRKLLDQLKMAYNEGKQQKAVEKEEKKEKFLQAWQKVKEKLEELLHKLKDTINATKEHRKEMMEGMRTTLSEIRTVIDKQKAIRAQRMQQRRDEYENVVNHVRSEIVALKDELDAREEELGEKRAEFKEKQKDLKDAIQNALKQSVEAVVVTKLGDKLQHALDKKMLEEIFSQAEETRNETVPVASKATLLDEYMDEGKTSKVQVSSPRALYGETQQF